jgi:hypothetical protein
MDALLDALLGFAKTMLVARGAFYPFAAVTTVDGRVQMVTAEIDEPSPEPGAVVAALEDRLRRDAAAGGIRGAGVCVDVRLEPAGAPASDAIRIEVEHAGAEPVRVFLPYVVEAPGRVVFGEIVAEPGRASVFPGGEGRE